MKTDLLSGPEIFASPWSRRGFWQIKLRWAVAPAMVAGVLLGRALGFEFAVVPILVIAAANAAYNTLFAAIFKRYEARLAREPRLDRLFSILEVVADYAAMFLLIHFTGGAWSPLAIFLIFHVVIAAVQFSTGVAHLFAAWAAAGLWLLLLGESMGWLGRSVLAYRGQPFHEMDRPVDAAVWLAFLTATLFITATMVSQIMRQLRDRVGALHATSRELALANHKLNGLYVIVRAIGAERRLSPILSIVATELADVLDIRAVAIKLLAEDGKTLRYVAAHGLPHYVVDNVIHVDRSPLNRRILAGETLVHGEIEDGEGAQLQAELTALGIQSALLTPLRVEDRVIGTLGIYAEAAGQFKERDADFLKLTAELVAIAIEDARANEAVEEMVKERTRFMLQVAHNLRAPLGASLGMIDLIRSGYMGEANERQVEYLTRVEGRLRALNETIGELLTIARTRDWSREIPDVVVDLAELAGRIERTFKQEADAKGLRLGVVTGTDLPEIDSGADLLGQLLENLVSNAIKYTPEGGEVEVRLARSGADEVQIVVRDSGIGIPDAEQGRLFSEFFRASNARKHTKTGSGLGLALVKQIVERHNGRIGLLSTEGRGTTVVVDLPVRQPKS